MSQNGYGLGQFSVHIHTADEEGFKPAPTICSTLLRWHIDHGSRFQNHVTKYTSSTSNVDSSQKTYLFKPTVNYLGFTLMAKGIKPNAAKVAVVHNWPRPHDKKSTSATLSFGLYYSRFIQGYAQKMGALYDVIGSGLWKWTVDQQQAFDKLKVLLTSDPILRRPNFSLMFIVQTD